MSFSDILLVEDDPNDVELIIRGLTYQNLTNRIVVTRDGVEALDYLYRRGAYARRNSSHPILILLDLKLPKVSGLEVLQQVKSDPELGVIPIVVMTSSKQDQDVLESYNLGVNAYVVKPVLFDHFIEAAKSIGLFWALINQPPIVSK